MEGDITRVSIRLVVFVGDLLRDNGVDPRAFMDDLPSFRDFRGRDELPDWVSWTDYLEVIHRLERVAGGPEGIARSMRATLKTAYSELRALSGFFAGPVPHYWFVGYQLMPTLVPALVSDLERLSEDRFRARMHIREPLECSLTYWHGTVTLMEVFPTHFGLPEARVEVLSMTERALDVMVDFPPVTSSVRWGDRAETLVAGEKEALHLATEGRPVAGMANQLASVMAKMDAVNREAFAEHERLRSAVRQAVLTLETQAAAPSGDGAGWSYLDDFESGGRRFVIAMRKEVDVLTERERQILAHAALGLHDKAIAYELGLADATVRVLLHRAAKKLGVRGRQEAIARFVKVGGAPPDE